MTDSFKDYPLSIGELRSEKTGGGSDWTPRDALIDVLRDIDSGTLDLDVVVIVMRQRSSGEHRVCNANYRIASPDHHTTLGVLGNAMFRLQSDIIRDD